MPEALKDRYNKQYIRLLSDHLANSQLPENFNKKKFVDSVFDKNWENRELKSRMLHISNSIHLALGENIKNNINTLVKIAPHFTGFEGMFIPQYIESYGLDNWSFSLKALEKTTEYASAEFAVRQFILKDKKRMMLTMLKWSKHKNHHVRRLASEGCRPRLPWACSLPDFKKDPRLIIPILDILKNDESLYVRRSVANNINDIAKDNPETIKDIIRLWQGVSSEQDWVLKHGARTLLKKGNQTTLHLFGYEHPKHVTLSHLACNKSLKIGDRLHFSFEINSNKVLGKLRIEYKIGFRKASKKTNYKIFKISEGDYQKNTLSFSKHHSFKQLSTRKHYPGEHKIIIVINGKDFANRKFTVI